MDTYDQDFMSSNEEHEIEKRINYFEVMRETLSKQGNVNSRFVNVKIIKTVWTFVSSCHCRRIIQRCG